MNDFDPYQTPTQACGAILETAAIIELKKADRERSSKACSTSASRHHRVAEGR